jgi:lysophospholipase L1-like esterase
MSQPSLPHGSVVAFYGDSLTSGFGASSPAVRWSSLLCGRRNWTEVNPSIPGIGFVQNRGDHNLPEIIINAHPDAILVTLGANDLRIVDTMALQIQTAIANDLQALREGAPDAYILVAMPFSPLSFRPPQLVSIEKWLRDGAALVSASVIESGAWITGRSDLTVDGIHFNDAGEKRVADLMDKAIDTAVACEGIA